MKDKELQTAEIEADTYNEDRQLRSHFISDLEKYRDYEYELELLREHIEFVQMKMDTLISNSDCEIFWRYTHENADYNDCLKEVKEPTQ